MRDPLPGFQRAGGVRTTRASSRGGGERAPDGGHCAARHGGRAAGQGRRWLGDQEVQVVEEEGRRGRRMRQRWQRQPLAAAGFR